MTTPPNSPPSSVVAEDGQAPGGAPTGPAAAPAGGQTVEVPLAAVGASKDGDTVHFKIISRDEQNGVANLAPVAAEAPEVGGSDDMAAEFDKSKMQQPA